MELALSYFRKELIFLHKLRKKFDVYSCKFTNVVYDMVDWTLFLINLVQFNDYFL